MTEADFDVRSDSEKTEAACRYVIELILHAHEKSSVDWKEEKCGNRSIEVKQKYYDQVGRSTFIEAVRRLQEMGMVQAVWSYGHSDLEKIRYRIEQLPELYALVGKKPKSVLLREQYQFVSEYMEKANTSWIKAYYSDLLTKLDHGMFPDDLEKYGEMLFRCMDALDGLREPMFIRIFSSRYLGDFAQSSLKITPSKVFEMKLESRVVSIARKYHPQVDESMEKYQVLEQLYLDHYGQELTIKGELAITLQGRPINLAIFPYGTVLNTETLKQAEISQTQNIRKIITVENKANFVSMPFEEGTLIVFSHGFFSPLERDFLKKLEQVLEEQPGEPVQYVHTGDLDYGGIRIFQHIRKNIFPKLQPYRMDAEQYDRYLPYASEMEDATLDKLKQMDEPRLQPLIDRIIAEKKVIEQEQFLTIKVKNQYSQDQSAFHHDC
jgi:hypothetical protein